MISFKTLGKSSVSSNVANETLSKRSCGSVVCGRARCEHWPRPGRHRRRGTRIENRLSRVSSNWYSIQSICSECLRPFQTRRTRSALSVRTDQAVATPGLPKEGAYSRENCPIHVCEGSAQLFGAVRRMSRPGSFQKPPGLPRDVAKRKKNRWTWKKRMSKTGPSGAWGVCIGIGIAIINKRK